MLNVRTTVLDISLAVLSAAGCKKDAESEPKPAAPESAEMAQEQPAEAAKPVETAPVADEPAKPSGTTCDQFAAQLADLFEKISGDEAMLTAMRARTAGSGDNTLRSPKPTPSRRPRRHDQASDGKDPGRLRSDVE